MTTFVPGQKVTANGFPGTVIRMYSENMVEVRLARGVVCVDAGDVQLRKDEPRDLDGIDCDRCGRFIPQAEIYTNGDDTICARCYLLVDEQRNRTSWSASWRSKKS